MSNPHPLDAAAREYWQQECAVHGEECWCTGYFSSREEAAEDMILTNGNPEMRPDCGSQINIVRVYAD